MADKCLKPQYVINDASRLFHQVHCWGSPGVFLQFLVVSPGGLRLPQQVQKRADKLARDVSAQKWLVSLLLGVRWPVPAHAAVWLRCGGCAQAELLMCTWAALEAGFLLKLKADFQLSVLPLCQLPSLSPCHVCVIFFLFSGSFIISFYYHLNFFPPSFAFFSWSKLFFVECWVS